MLTDILDDLINAHTENEKKRIYRTLEKVGVDRYTAKIMAAARKEELKKDGENKW